MKQKEKSNIPIKSYNTENFFFNCFPPFCLAVQGPYSSSPCCSFAFSLQMNQNRNPTIVDISKTRPVEFIHSFIFAPTLLNFSNCIQRFSFITYSLRAKYLEAMMSISWKNDQVAGLLILSKSLPVLAWCMQWNPRAIHEENELPGFKTNSIEVKVMKR